MSDLVTKQAVTRRSIERTITNFKKLGRENITAAKVRSRIATLQESWARYQETHVQLLRSTPETELQSSDYFRGQEFEATEESYQAARDALTDFLEDLEPVVSPSLSHNSTSIVPEPSGLALPNLPKLNLPPFDEYFQFMNEYEKLQHMQKITSLSSSNRRVFIPHHPVIREDSATTHLRVVFNASSRFENGFTLNDFLHAGPKLQTELPAILLQWRSFRYVYTADIAKMFRQILIDQRDLDFQCILWQDNDSISVDEYHL
ncbi:uncharacterized protein [Cardiocondyla obscurior]|uniref:uncharacterized protein n=1 Tax=Cardiocondyla obscurior TaxID=286306 RepID=UPI0039656330